LFGRGARLHRRDQHGGEVHLGEPIDAKARERERPDDGQREDENGREDRTFDAQRSQPLHTSTFPELRTENSKLKTQTKNQNF
jgi:hypothetical protein